MVKVIAVYQIPVSMNEKFTTKTRNTIVD